MKTLAIVGSHPLTRDLFDWTRTDCDVWVFNEARSNNTLPRADAVFQMHVPAIWKNPKNRNDPKHFEWLQTQQECPVYMQEQYPDVPMSLRYPLEQALDLLKGDPNHFLSSSVSLALALAVLNGYMRVEVYGVAMETNSEYLFQREGFAFWMGFLKGRGVEFHFASETFQCPIYGYEGAVAIEYTRFDERIEEIKPMLDELGKRYTVAVVNLNQAIDAFIEDSGAENERTLYDAVDAQKQLGDQLGILDGAIQENEKYKGKAEEMRLVSGGEFALSRQEFESSAKTLIDKSKESHVAFVAAGTQLGNAHNAIRQAARGSPKRIEMGKIYRSFLQQYLNVNNQAAVYRGAGQENLNYMAWLDKRIKAAGGSKSEAVLLEAMQNAV